ncbi:MAG TPA: phosphate acyltransferase PlsX [Acidimicrobiales bacterium]|nr:phosphate acyltransferase PlsX [Acidimicrobiales bacterium]
MPDGPVRPVAVDAMGGDHAPSAVVTGARDAVDQLGIPVVLVGPPDLVGDTMGLELVACTEVITMDDDPGQAVRRKKDSSLVRAAELVRDGLASATVSAGNTGAAMAAALLRMGRLKGVSRPCIATPLPRPGTTPTLLCDAGANAECTPEMLVQFAQMAAAHARTRFGVASPTVGLLSIGEEKSKGTPLVKETHQRLADPAAGVNFFGNVEGRDLIGAPVDVVVTDGFTGNVALKTLEGALRFMSLTIAGVIGIDERTRAAGDVLLEHLAPIAGELDPEAHGGAILLGVDGVAIISHGSSSARAITNAVRVAHELATQGTVEALRAAIGGQ